MLHFYDKSSYSSGWRYLEAAPADENNGVEWAGHITGYGTYIGVASTGIGSGAANTSTIVSAQGGGSYAARIIFDMELNGYTDWFLPSKDELNSMYQNLHLQGVGAFAAAEYWTSSEFNAYHARYQNFGDGYQYYNIKLNPKRVQAVRQH